MKNATIINNIRNIDFIKSSVYVILLVSFALTGCNDEGEEPKCLCSAECTESCEEVLLTDETISVDGKSRKYDLYLPPLHEISTDLPVVIDLHGFTESPQDQRTNSNFTPIAKEENFITVWPKAAANGENCLLAGASGLYWNADWGGTVEDIEFINALIDQVGSDYNVDLSMVYVTGLSNGGFMAYSLACALSDRIAAVASVAGSMTENLLTNTCQPSRQIPILQVHGTNDRVIFWDGEPTCKGGIAAIEVVVAFWRTNAGCSSTFTELQYENVDTSDGSTARILTYDDCSGKMKFLIVDGGGHNWPGSRQMMANPNALLRPINNDINASEIIWSFLKEHQLP
ncbi:MAG: PHB depolymerase family esterase [Cyclobacteriaceae bacterium]